MRNLYSGALIDMKKVEEHAYKTSHDKCTPEDVTIHYHLYGEPCNLYEHKKYKKRMEVEDV